MEKKAEISGIASKDKTVWTIEIFNNNELHSQERFAIPYRMDEKEMMEFLIKVEEFAKNYLVKMGAVKIK